MPPRFACGPVLAAGTGPPCLRPADTVGRRTTSDYRVNRKTPRADDSTSVPPGRVTVVSPLNKLVYAFPNVMVGQAARVHASTGPAVRVCAENANAPLHMLQSTRVDSRSAAMVKVYLAPTGVVCSG